MRYLYFCRRDLGYGVVARKKDIPRDCEVVARYREKEIGSVHLMMYIYNYCEIKSREDLVECFKQYIEIRRKIARKWLGRELKQKAEDYLI